MAARGTTNTCAHTPNTFMWTADRAEMTTSKSALKKATDDFASVLCDKIMESKEELSLKQRLDFDLDWARQQMDGGKMCVGEESAAYVSGAGGRWACNRVPVFQCVELDSATFIKEVIKYPYMTLKPTEICSNVEQLCCALVWKYFTKSCKMNAAARISIERIYGGEGAGSGFPFMYVEMQCDNPVCQLRITAVMWDNCAQPVGGAGHRYLNTKLFMYTSMKQEYGWCAIDKPTDNTHLTKMGSLCTLCLVDKIVIQSEERQTAHYSIDKHFNPNCFGVDKLSAIIFIQFRLRHYALQSVEERNRYLEMAMEILNIPMSAHFGDELYDRFRWLAFVGIPEPQLAEEDKEILLKKCIDFCAENAICWHTMLMRPLWKTTQDLESAAEKSKYFVKRANAAALSPSSRILRKYRMPKPSVSPVVSRRDGKCAEESKANASGCIAEIGGAPD